MAATATRPTSSPSSSPRLPSPPPMAEDQTKPMSPDQDASSQPSSISARAADEAAALRRIRPGMKAIDIAAGPPLVTFEEIDSAFQLAEHLKALHHNYTRPEGPRGPTVPLSSEQSQALAEPPTGIDRSIWLYELARFLVNELSNKVMTSLINSRPQCSAETCPEMRASEWQYLCAVHTPPKACCAFDYCNHTLDWATNSLTSQTEFPSRLSLSNDRSSDATPQVKTITNIMRRVYRIFAHAWFSHRTVFWKVEHKWGLYLFFKTVCDSYSLIPDDNYTIPPEAEGRDPDPQQNFEGQPQTPPQPKSILQKATDTSAEPSPSNTASTSTSNSNTLSTPAAAGATARRHRHTPSKGAPVDTVPEEENEDDEPSNTPIDDEPEDQYDPPLRSPSPIMPGPARRDTQIHVEIPTERESTAENVPPTYSPASPKAATREELQEMKEEERGERVEEGKAEGKVEKQAAAAAAAAEIEPTQEGAEESQAA